MTESGREPIAIVGIGCRFPGASGPEAFWRLLAEGRDAIGEIPPTRWNRDALYHDDPVSAPGTIRTRLGGFLEGIEQFDATFFGISPREATAMDPQQRLLLETSWEALEDAGLVVDRLAGEKVGVFVGIAAYDYAEIQHAYDNRHLIGPHTNTGLALSIAANRISYIFDFRGPSVAVDTACSSSLVAAHLACRSLLAGECRVALVGGVNAILKPEATIGFSRASMLAPDGRCKTFDARANGYTRGEGAGVVVLKRLSDARREGDHIYALIRGSSVNQDGRTKGMSVPSREAQEAALRDAFAASGVEPAQVQYVEAHGTGTPVGDPIEARALGAVLGLDRPEGDYCRIGSVKTNIGHLEAAAGIAGLIKSALAIERRVIPSSLNFERLNPEIPLDALKLRVVTQAEPWPDNGHPARAGVNSFGFGGTNAHVLIEEAPPPPAAEGRTARAPGAVILPISARTPEALRALAASCADALEQDGAGAETRRFCYWASARRAHHVHRAAIVGPSAEDLVAGLRGLASADASQSDAGRIRSTPRLVFVYSGMGAQWWAMGRQLLDAEPVFRDAIEQCDALFARRSGWSLLQALTADKDGSRMGRADVAQPCNFALQLALTSLWRSWGIVPGAIVGHSAGEIAAGHAAGILTLEDAVDVAYHRSRLQQKTAGRGKMAAVGLAKAEALRRVAAYDGRVSVAAVNGPNSLTLSGDGAALDELVPAFEREGIFARFLRVDVPYHSHHMDALEAELREALARLRPRRASIPLYSTVTGEIAEEGTFDADYWWRNIREPVEFAGAIGRIAEAGGDTFVEISPHPVLASAVSECLSALAAPGTVVPSLRRESDDRLTMLQSLGTLYARGADVDWKGVYPETEAFARLPRYPWQRQSYWHESAHSKTARLTETAHPLLGLRRSTPRPEWETLLDARVLGFLGDHRVEDSIVFPGAGYVEMALAVAREELGTAAVVVEDVAFERALVLPEAEPVHAVVSYDAESAEVAIHASADGVQWERHAHCSIRALRDAGGDRDIASLRAACAREMAEPYEIFARAGLGYGPAFRRIERLWQGPQGAVARLSGAEGSHDIGRYLLHPTVLDACFQLLVGALAAGDGAFEAYLPIGIGKVVVYASPPAAAPLWAQAWVTERRETRVAGDMVLMDENGRLLVEVRGLACQALGRGRSAAQALANALYAFRWRPDNIGHVAASGTGLLAPREIAGRVRPRLADIADPGERATYYSVVEPALDQACARIAADALAQLGHPVTDGARIDIDRLCRDIGAQGYKSRLLRRMTAMLEKTGAGRREQRLAETPGSGAGVAGILEPLAQRFARYAPEIELLRRCAEHLPQVLRGEVEPLQLIFPEGSLAVAERIYRDSRSFGIYNAIAREAVRAIVEALPEKSTLRIIEIGAGVGSLTAEVLGLFPEDRTQYVFTDISGNFTQKAAQQFSRYRFAEFRAFDLETPPAEQGFAPGGFHIVLASDVIHATRDLRQSLRHIAELLAPGGLLIASELTNPPFWFDLVFGLLPGWWAFEDEETRPDHACVSGAVWRDLLRGTGFPEVELLSEGRDAGDTIHSVILARRSEAAEAQPAASAKIERGTWLLLRDGTGAGARLADALRRMGQRVVLADRAARFEHVGSNHFTVAPDSREDMRTLLDTVRAKSPDLRGVVHLWSLDRTLEAEGAAAAVVGATQENAGSLLALMQALVERQEQAPPRLVAVTAGAGQVLGSDEVDPVQASLWGLGRVFLNEHPEIACRMVDLSASPEESDFPLLAAECLSEGNESEVALRAGSRFVHRLEAMQLGHLAEGHQRALRGGEILTLDYARTGALDALVLRAGARAAPGPGEIEIEVAAAGLNFRDVMKVLGIYPTEGAARLSLGDECAGTVVALGAGVEDLSPGDRVMAIASGFASRVIVDRRLVARLPDGVSFVEGATIPIAFLTAYYALERLAHLAPQERILIHAAAGGVGQAACQLARLRRATIFATAGSEEKRDFLRSLGIEHVMDSRSLDFADRISEITRGEGIDVVLNSLSGRAIAKSLALLRPYGRFLEIGKTDIYRDSKLGLLPFRRNLAYFAIDLDAVLTQQRPLAQELLAAIAGNVAAGAYTPLPHHVFAISEAERAFRYMAQAKHIGKIVLSMAAPRVKLLPRKFAALPFRRDACYVITGGLGGIGRALVPWMIDHGARHIVLMGRSGASHPDAQRDLEAARAKGADVVAMQCDVADESALRAALETVRRQGPPLRGVFHCAMVLDDGLIPQLDAERLRRVLVPKIGGAWAMHRQTLDDPLDFFVLFSSFAAIVGNIGQANYAAANAFLDGLAAYRRAAGRPALTVDWGAIGARGYVAEHAEIEQHFRRQGLRSFPPDQAFAVLEALLRESAGQVSVVDLDWAAWARHAPGIANSPRFQYVVKEETSEAGAGDGSGLIVERLRAAPSGERKQLMLEAIQGRLAAVLGLSAEAVDVNRAPSELGLDSLMAVELSCAIEDRLGFKPGTLELIQVPSLAALADRFIERLAL